MREKIEWKPVEELVTEGSIGQNIVRGIDGLGKRPRPETTFNQPLETFKGSLNTLQQAGFTTIGEILQLTEKELQSLPAPQRALRDKLTAYLDELQITPHSRLVGRVMHQEQTPVPVTREEELVLEVNSILADFADPSKHLSSKFYPTRHAKLDAEIIKRQFGLVDGIRQSTKVLSHDFAISESRVSQRSLKSISELWTYYRKQIKGLQTVPENSFGKMLFNATLAQDIPLFGENIYVELDHNTARFLHTIAFLKDTIHFDDLVLDNFYLSYRLPEWVRENVAGALLLSIQTKIAATQRINQLRRLEEQKRLETLGKPVNNLIPELRLTPDQLVQFDSTALVDLSLPTYVHNTLTRGGIKTIGQLLRKNAHELRGVTGFGKGSLDELALALSKTFHMDSDTLQLMKDNWQKQLVYR